MPDGMSSIRERREGVPEASLARSVLDDEEVESQPGLRRTPSSFVPTAIGCAPSGGGPPLADALIRVAPIPEDLYVRLVGEHLLQFRKCLDAAPPDDDARHVCMVSRAPDRIAFRRAGSGDASSAWAHLL